MVKVIFRCDENRNSYQEEFEFDDNMTDEQIQEEYENWVWNKVSDNFRWYREGEE